MIEQPSGDDQLGARMLAHDSLLRVQHRSAASSVDALHARELSIEMWMRTMAVYVWCAVFVFVFLSGFMFWLRGLDIEVMAEMGHAGFYTFEALASVALLLALILTFAWLYRLRSLSAARIERRLASLEAMLERDR